MPPRPGRMLFVDGPRLIPRQLCTSQVARIGNPDSGINLSSNCTNSELISLWDSLENFSSCELLLVRLGSSIGDMATVLACPENGIKLEQVSLHSHQISRVQFDQTIGLSIPPAMIRSNLLYQICHGRKRQAWIRGVSGIHKKNEGFGGSIQIYLVTRQQSTSLSFGQLSKHR